MKSLHLIIATLFAIVMAGCSVNNTQLKQVLADNPDIVLDAIKANPEKFLNIMNEARIAAQTKQREMEIAELKRERDEQFLNPLQPTIDEKRAILGNLNAPITIVEYSDFECPYCAQGYQTILEVRKKYGDQVRFVYKHLPLSFHPKALPAAQYFEAIALQDSAKAYQFHDYIFENQEKLINSGVSWLKESAKKFGLDMKKLEKDLASDAVKQRIEADSAEAQNFGMTGTPGFLINGVALKGAFPAQTFEEIIDRHLKISPVQSSKVVE